ncbi:MAG: NAD(+) synthase [Peptoniphilaceae bacterium]|nr:NAD(+) synthase [Peptoniphilaceae bacterium]MDY6019236.1 NAD(+) synthase [Anaerococcus sp.]
MRKNIKIKSVSFKTKLGNVYENLKSIKKEIERAEQEKVNILSFPELSLTGASLYHGYLDKNIIKDSKNALYELKDFSEKYDLLFTVGLPFKASGKLVNAVMLINNGRILGGYAKENLKDYEKEIFSDDYEKYSFIDEDIYQLNDEFIEANGIKIAVSIGEDEEKIIPNSLKFKEKGVDIILNPQASTRYALSGKEIEEKIKYLSKGITYVYTSTGFGESSTDFVYEGLNIIANDGKIEESEKFGPAYYIKDYEFKKYANDSYIDDFIYINFNNLTEKKIKVHPFPYLPPYEDRAKFCTDVLEIQALGLLNRMNNINIEKVCLGVSGGLDSTMALLSIVEAFKIGKLDKNNILAYTMPAFATSDRTKSNAYKLCQALNIDLKEIDITKSVTQHLIDIGHDIENKDTAYENAQARERTQVLLDIANMYGAIVIGTGDLSEIAQGFATYNGDHMSNYSLNSSLTKTEIRYIIRYLAETSSNKKLSEVLTEILDTPISPELVKEKDGEISQKTEDILGPYELIDFFIYETLDKGYEVEKVYSDAKIAFGEKYDDKTIKKWLKSFYKRFISSQFKRSTSVDSPAVRKKTLSPRTGYRLPSDMESTLYIRKLNEL